MINFNTIDTNTQTRINFKSKGNQEAKSLSPQEILYFSSIEPNKRMYNVSKNVAKTLIALPFIDTTLTFLAKNGNLATKMKSSATTAGIWAAAGIAGVLTHAARNKLDNKFFSDFRQNHPTISGITNFMITFAIFKMILSAPTKLVKVVKNPDYIKNKVIQPIKTKINNTYLNKNIIEKANTKIQNIPYLAKGINIVAKLATPVIFIATLARFMNELKTRNNNINANYELISSLQNKLYDTKVVN